MVYIMTTNMSNCGVGDICEIKDNIVKDRMTEVAELCGMNSSFEDTVYAVYQEDKKAKKTFYLFSGPAGNEKLYDKCPIYDRAVKLAEYIKEHNLGEVTASPFKMNRNHGPHKIGVFIWEPDFEAVQKWVDTVYAGTKTKAKVKK